MHLEVKGISKSFGEKRVLDQVSFSAESGLAMGLLGRNGAGKTTTIRIIMHVFPPDEGQVLLDGQPLHAETASIGYLPEEKGLYPKFKIADQLIYLGKLRGLSHSQSAQAVDHWLERLSLTDYRDKKLETLSKGNQQKIQLALALLTDPKIVILDEPFSGLDPVNAQLLKDIVREQVRLGKIVLFSSHQMSYVEQFCDQVALLDQGQIVLQGCLKDIKREQAQGRLYIQIAAEETETAHNRHAQPDSAAYSQISALLQGKPQLADSVLSLETSGEGCLLHLKQPDSTRDILSLLAENRLKVEQFRLAEPSLEDIFVEKVGERREASSI